MGVFNACLIQIICVLVSMLGLIFVSNRKIRLVIFTLSFPCKRDISQYAITRHNVARIYIAESLCAMCLGEKKLSVDIRYFIPHVNTSKPNANVLKTRRQDRKTTYHQHSEIKIDVL